MLMPHRPNSETDTLSDMGSPKTVTGATTTQLVGGPRENCTTCEVRLTHLTSEVSPTCVTTDVTSEVRLNTCNTDVCDM